MFVRDLLTFLGYKYDDSGIKKADADVDSYKKNVLGLAGALTVSLASFAGTIMSAIHFGDEIQKNSEQLGIGVEQLQKWQYAAGTADLSAQQFSTGVGILSRNFLQAQSGSKSAQEAFAQLGINANNFKNTDDLLFAISDKISKMPDGFRKVGIAQELLGKSGKAWIPLLNMAPDKIKQIGQEAQDLGIIFGEDMTKSADEVNDRLFQLNYIFKSLIRGVGAQFIPLIHKLTDEFLKWLSANSKLIGQGMAGFFESMTKSAGILWKALRFLFETTTLLLKPFGGLEKNIKAITGVAGFGLMALLVKNLVPWIVSLTGSLFGLDAAMLPVVGTIGAIVLGILALIAIIEDLYVYSQGGQSVFGDLFGNELQSDMKKVFDFLSMIVTKMEQFIGLIGKAGQFLSDFHKYIPGVGFLFGGASDLYSQGAAAFGGGSPERSLTASVARPRLEGFGSLGASSSQKSEFSFGDINVSINGADGVNPDKLALAFQDRLTEFFNDQQFNAGRPAFSGMNK